MTDAEKEKARAEEDAFYERLESPRTCKRCGLEGKAGDFPCTTARGKFLIRSWCPKCLKQYYRDRYRKKKTKCS